MKIRKFRSEDRERVRRLACRNARGYPGKNASWIADILTGYYTDFEPEHLLIAERGSQMVGYLAGCFDSNRSRWVKAFRVIPRAIGQALIQGEISYLELRYFGSLLSAAIHNLAKGFRSLTPKGFPAHFHVSIRDAARGRGVGTMLVEKFLEDLREEEVEGVYARVREDNEAGLGFFQSLGFRKMRSYRIALYDGEKVEHSRSVLLVKKLS